MSDPRPGTRSSDHCECLPGWRIRSAARCSKDKSTYTCRHAPVSRTAPGRLGSPARRADKVVWSSTTGRAELTFELRPALAVAHSPWMSLPQRCRRKGRHPQPTFRAQHADLRHAHASYQFGDVRRSLMSMKQPCNACDLLSIRSSVFRASPLRPKTTRFPIEEYRDSTAS